MKLMSLIREDKCPHCGGGKGGLMPPDFETHKCDECGKNWTDDYAINHALGAESTMEEAQTDTPGQVLKKAQLAKTRSDMQQLTQKQKTIGQSRKNTKDTPTRRRLSKQIADLGAKKADLGVRTAEMGAQIKKKPTVGL